MAPTDCLQHARESSPPGAAEICLLFHGIKQEGSRTIGKKPTLAGMHRLRPRPHRCPARPSRSLFVIRSRRRLVLSVLPGALAPVHVHGLLCEPPPAFRGHREAARSSMGRDGPRMNAPARGRRVYLYVDANATTAANPSLTQPRVTIMPGGVGAELNSLDAVPHLPSRDPHAALPVRVRKATSCVVARKEQ